MNDVKLLPLPDPEVMGTSRYGTIFRGHGDEAMRAYARACIEAAEKERARLAEEARIRADEEKRAANKAHRGRINRAAADALTEAGLSEADAVTVIKLIATGKVPAVSINY